MAPFARLALTLIAAGMLAGCGHAVDTTPAPVIDTVFNHLPASQAKQAIAQQQADRNASTTKRPDTTSAGQAPTNGNGLN